MFENIYDFGANKGQNIDYFYRFTNRVIAIEPIPDLYNQIKEKYEFEINNKKLLVLNSAVVTDEETRKIDFFVNSEKSWESTLIKNEKYKKIEVNAVTPNALFKINGFPDYLKIDIENFDLEVLKYLHINKITPRYVSFEAQNSDILDFVINNFDYKYFNFVLGHRISKDYEHLGLQNNSSGPICDDLKFTWVSKSMIKKYMTISKYGWVDIHCTNEIYGTNSVVGTFRTILYLLIDRVYRYFKPLKNRIIGKLEHIFKKP